MNIKELNVEFDKLNNRRNFNYNDKTINKIKELNLDIYILLILNESAFNFNSPLIIFFLSE